MAKPVTLRCKDCKKSWTVDPDIPLNELIEQGKVEGGHVWSFGGRKYGLCHPRRDDYLGDEEWM